MEIVISMLLVFGIMFHGYALIYFLNAKILWGCTVELAKELTVRKFYE